MKPLCCNRIYSVLALVAVFILGACDPDGKKNCDWVLEPEPNNIGLTTGGLIPVCARNRRTMKQDCRLQIELERAKSYYGKTFRYVDLKVASYGIPRTIETITFCP